MESVAMRRLLWVERDRLVDHEARPVMLLKQLGALVCPLLSKAASDRRHHDVYDELHVAKNLDPSAQFLRRGAVESLPEICDLQAEWLVVPEHRALGRHLSDDRQIQR
jgi:hypothetical protein